jgi:hypothetical protein
MAGVPLAARTRESQRISDVLSMEHELFASNVAAGMSCPQAAESAGFARDYGVALAKAPKIAARIEELLDQRRAQPAEEIVSKAWIETQLVTIIRGAMRPQEPGAIRPDYATAGLNLMRLAQLRGYVVTRSANIDGRVDFGKVSNTQLSAALEGYTNMLDPEMRERIRALAAGGDPEDSVTISCGADGRMSTPLALLSGPGDNSDDPDE